MVPAGLWQQGDGHEPSVVRKGNRPFTIADAKFRDAGDAVEGDVHGGLRHALKQQVTDRLPGVRASRKAPGGTDGPSRRLALERSPGVHVFSITVYDQPQPLILYANPTGPAVVADRELHRKAPRREDAPAITTAQRFVGALLGGPVGPPEPVGLGRGEVTPALALSPREHTGIEKRVLRAGLRFPIAKIDDVVSDHATACSISTRVWMI